MKGEKGRRKVYVKGIRGRRDFGRTMTFVVSREFMAVNFDQLRHRVGGGFGHGGQDIHRYPGAR